MLFWSRIVDRKQEAARMARAVLEARTDFIAGRLHRADHMPGWQRAVRLLHSGSQAYGLGSLPDGQLDTGPVVANGARGEVAGAHVLVNILPLPCAATAELGAVRLRDWPHHMGALPSTGQLHATSFQKVLGRVPTSTLRRGASSDF